ncbi:MAG TPA: RtcB family protein [Candidatus Thermoplasmatota archaeon]|nr:RtcB family protein [Candidatus Thermoplasmatota archaeon]
MDEKAHAEHSPRSTHIAVPLAEEAPFRYVIPRSYKPEMRTEGLIFSSPALIEGIRKDNAADQVANVATLPGLVGRSLAMPDIHWGYGFPIGGVAAFDADAGVVSPGGIGFDINCGVRLLRTNLDAKDIAPKVKELIDTLFSHIPTGVGGKGAISAKTRINELLTGGAQWAIDEGYGWASDAAHLEEQGRMEGARPEAVSDKAKRRGGPQVGSLGSGNHFLEVQCVDQILDEATAKAYGIGTPGQVVVMMHTGSRGLGHQVCTDYVESFVRHERDWGVPLIDRQLACAPLRTKQAQDYLGGMMAAANFAWGNRQLLTFQTREAFKRVFGQDPQTLGMEIVYDVSHNMAKLEEHRVDGGRKKLLVHRKGATRSFGPMRSEVTPEYREFGQPVLVPGDMGTASWVLAGTNTALGASWGSCCHGAGRQMSRAAANKAFQHDEVLRNLRAQKIQVRALTRVGVTEEAPGAYKNVDEVVDVCHRAGLGRKVVRLRPLGVIKG